MRRSVGKRFGLGRAAGAATLLSVIALCLLPRIVQSQASLRQTPQLGLILGRVVEGTSDNPVADAFVDLRGRELSQGFSALTDADGNFVFLDLPAGTYNLQATKTGYFRGTLGQRRINGSARPLVLAVGQAVEVRLPIWKEWAISGTVRDDIGEPVVGIAVQVIQSFARGGRLLRSTASPTVRTDDRGIYRITGLFPGEVALSIPTSELIVASGGNGDSGSGIAYAPTFRPGEVGAPSSATIGSGEERTGADFQLTLGVTRSVSGRLEGDGASGGTTVRIVFSDDRSMADTVVVETETRPGRTFAFPQVPTGSYLLRVFDRSATDGDSGGGAFAAAAAPGSNSRSPGADADGHWGSVAIVVGESDLSDVVVPLHTSAHIGGRLVFNGASQPGVAAIERMRVSAERADGRYIFAPGGSPPRTDANGEFTTFGLPPGSYFLFPVLQFVPAGWALESISLNGRDALNEPIAVEDADIEGLEIRLIDQVPEVTGSVRTTRGEPDVDADVLVFPADPRRWINFGSTSPRFRSVRVGLDGTFVFTRLPPGEYLAAAVDDEAAGEWQTQATLERLSRTATKFVVSAGSKQSLTLRVSSVR